jgi:hypothetical protein
LQYYFYRNESAKAPFEIFIPVLDAWENLQNSQNVKLFGTLCETLDIAMKAQKYCLTL